MRRGDRGHDPNTRRPPIGSLLDAVPRRRAALERTRGVTARAVTPREE